MPESVGEEFLSSLTKKCKSHDNLFIKMQSDIELHLSTSRRGRIWEDTPFSALQGTGSLKAWNRFSSACASLWGCVFQPHGGTQALPSHPLELNCNLILRWFDKSIQNLFHPYCLILTKNPPGNLQSSITGVCITWSKSGTPVRLSCACPWECHASCTKLYRIN